MNKMIMLITLFCLPVMAAPDWVDSPPKEDEDYLYYIGRSEPAVSEARARKLAFTDAYEQAIQENFGFQAGFEKSEYQSDQDSRQVKGSFVSTKNVQFKDFQIVDSYITRDDQMYQVQALYRYRKSAIQEAKDKLENDHGEALQKFSIVGDKRLTDYGGLQVITEPAGAKVIIDGEVYSKTPVRIFGQLKPGPHILTLDHPSYEIFEQHIFVSAGQVAKVRQVLKPASGVLVLRSEPPGAVVTFNQQVFERKTPFVLPAAPVGQDLTFDFSRAGYHTQTIRDIKVDRGERREVTVRLTPLHDNFSYLGEEPSESDLELEVPSPPMGIFLFTNFSVNSSQSPISEYDQISLLGTALDMNLNFRDVIGFTYSAEAGGRSRAHDDFRDVIHIAQFKRTKLSLWLVNSISTDQDGHDLWQFGIEQDRIDMDLVTGTTNTVGVTKVISRTGMGVGGRVSMVSKHHRGVFTIGGGVTQYGASQGYGASMGVYFQIGMGFSVLRGP